MGSGNSTDSVSPASDLAERLKAGLRNIARAVHTAALRVARRPVPRMKAEKEAFVIATERRSFVWNVSRGRKGSSDEELPPLFVRVEPDPVVEQSESREWPDKPMAEKVYSTPSYSTISSPTSSGAVMYEFSSSRFDLDMLDMEEATQTEVYEAPVYMDQYESEEERQFFEDLYEDLEVEAVLEYMDTIDLYRFHVDTEEERQFYESLYEDLTVDAVLEYMDTIELYAAYDYDSLYEDLEVEAVLDYMDTIDLYHSDKVAEIETAAEPVLALDAPVSNIAGYIEAPVSNVAGYIEAPAAAVLALEAPVSEVQLIEAPVTVQSSLDEYIEAEAECQFFEGLYEDLTVMSVIEYMDTIDLDNYYVETEVEKQFFEDLYEDLEVEAVLEYMDTIDLENHHVETEEEKQYFEGLYEDLAVGTVLEYMDRVEIYAKPAPEYVISEIGMPEECETTIDIEPEFVPDYVISEIATAEMCETFIKIEQPVAQPEIQAETEQIDVARKSIMAQFIFGFDAPARASPGPTKFRFIAGTEEDDEDDTEEVQIMTYSGDAAVSAQSFSNGPLAL